MTRIEHLIWRQLQLVFHTAIVGVPGPIRQRWVRRVAIYRAVPVITGPATGGTEDESTPLTPQPTTLMATMIERNGVVASILPVDELSSGPGGHPARP